ncbi:hypothetical protein OJAV_G00132430 [Oryzias javanicus]|uniref:Uncharacterized protein n=1 Tax=Oryzias javanicus TaxID=123683 RepID=A0A3S2PZ40_ORYJA|nr:hypothetical protein OJAV_G00132430 [Oryzias javanicus]
MHHWNRLAPHDSHFQDREFLLRCPTHSSCTRLPFWAAGGKPWTPPPPSSSHRSLSLGRANSNQSSLDAETGGEVPSEPPGADGLRVSRLGGSGVQPAPA